MGCRFAFIMTLALPRLAWGSFESNQLAISGGLFSTSFAETTNLDPTSTPSSGSVGTLSAGIEFEHFFSDSRSFVMGIQLPALPSNQSFQAGFMGFNFWVVGMGSAGSFIGEGASVRFKPGFRVSVGPIIGLGYLVYSTQSARKSDVGALFGADVAASLSFGERMGCRLGGSFFKTTGIATSGFGYRGGLAFTYTL